MKKLLIISFVLFLCSNLIASESRIELKSFYSDALGINKNFNIYFPKDYDSSIQRYPVIYLFRGHEDEWVDPWEDDSRGGQNIKDVVDKLFKENKIGKMIFVMPGVSSVDNSIPGLGVNFINVGLAGPADGIGTGRFNDYLIKDLINHIDSNYNTVNSRFYRGVDGFSLGGYTSVMLVTKNPELFISAGAYDGTMMWLDFDDLRSSGFEDDDTWLSTSMFDPAFDSPRNIPFMKNYNMCNLINEGSQSYIDTLKDIQFLLHSGGSPERSNLTETQHVVDLLAEKGIDNVFDDIRLTNDAVHNWHFADLHMSKSIPYHWEKFQSAENTIDISLTTPLSYTEISGVKKIEWTLDPALDTSCIILRYRNKINGHWQQMAELTDNQRFFDWNTLIFPDGIFYQIQLLVYSGSDHARVESENYFTINNPGNASPEMSLTQPSQNDTVKNNYEIKWNGGDADGDSLVYSIDVSTDNGNNWESLVENIQENKSYSWNTTNLPNSPFCKLVLNCSDGTVEVKDTSNIFIIANDHYSFPENCVTHLNGNGSGSILPFVVDSSQLKDHRYQITLDDSTDENMYYSVKDITINNQIFQDKQMPKNDVEGHLFDGIRLKFYNYSKTIIDAEKTGWEIGETGLKYNISLPQIDMGTEILEGFPYPADYSIKIFDHVVDTSSSAFGIQTIPIKFSVYNITDDRSTEIIFIDIDSNGQLTRNDEIYILEKDKNDEWILCWLFTLSGNENDFPPQPGDIFHIKTLKPFTSSDVFEFSNEPSEIVNYSQIPNEINLKCYPNPANISTTFDYYLPEAGLVRISIYNILGQKIITLVNKIEEDGSHRIPWDCVNKNGTIVSTGIYFVNYYINYGAGRSDCISKKLVILK